MRLDCETGNRKLLDYLDTDGSALVSIELEVAVIGEQIMSITNAEIK